MFIPTSWGNIVPVCILGLPSPWEEAIEKWNAEDAQFWNYKWDFEGIKIDDIPRWKTRPPKFLVLFQWKIGNMWLPPGPPTYAAAALFTQHEQDACDALLLLGKINVGSTNIVPNMEKDNADDPRSNTSGKLENLNENQQSLASLNNVRTNAQRGPLLHHKELSVQPGYHSAFMPAACRMPSGRGLNDGGGRGHSDRNR